jgi:hypothetical protein
VGETLGPLYADVDDDDAIELLKKLRDNTDARAEIEANPRQGLKKHLGIDFPNAPSSVTLPDPSTIGAYIQELESEQTKGAQSKYANLSHGIILLYVAHGNGLPGPPQPRV